MVLQDTPVMNMSIETMMKVLRPKVDGSKNLDELFQEDTLDFFIFFSSLACVFGNSGQSNYAAANAFMISLAAQRRKKGLAASVIDIGAIMGIGYMAREVSQSVLDQLRKAGYMWMSERDFQLAFAEAILAGRPESKENPELITGLRVVSADEELKTPWFSNPKFQHCIMGQQERADTSKHNLNSAVFVRDQLLVATTQEEVYEILKGKILSMSNTFKGLNDPPIFLRYDLAVQKSRNGQMCSP